MNGIMRLLARHGGVAHYHGRLLPHNSQKRLIPASVRMQSSGATETYYKHGLRSLSERTKLETVAAGLSNFKNVPFTSSPFVKPVSVTFDQVNGNQRRERKWDYIEVHDSVATLLYRKDDDVLLLVRQFRPTVYARALRKARQLNQPDPPLDRGFTYELCAGLVDKDKSLAEIAREEIEEECGYSVPLPSISEVASYVSAIGAEGTIQTLFFAEVTEEMRIRDGGGLEHDGEAIELLALPFQSIDAFIFDASLPKSTGLMFAFKWLQDQKRTYAADRS